ncbi:MAG: signal peptidase II [Actinomycetaceae bacterium]|nr:signal peptidase II [Actinomycetaceae bacterium]
MRTGQWRCVAMTFGAVGLPTVALDQASKAAALAWLAPDVPYPLLGRVLSLQLVHNPGAAFSFASSSTWVFTIVATIVVVGVAVVSAQVRNRLWQLSLGLLVGGAAGNLIDRLVQPPSFGQGHVVDFINYNGWFIGNVADIAIVAAVVAVMILTARGVPMGRTDEEER